MCPVATESTIVIVGEDSTIVTIGPISGPPGSSGGPADFTTIAQKIDVITPSATWVLNHTLAFRPNVTLVDSAGDEFTADSMHYGTNQIIVNLSAPQGGYALLS